MEVYEGTDEQMGVAMSSLYDEAPSGFDQIEPWVETCAEKWRSAWSASSHLVADESMVFWVGGGAPHLTIIPRKPTPLGIMLKTLCCAETGIMVNCEVSHAKDAMHSKEFFAEWGHTTATTLRLLKPYFRPEGARPTKTLFADSWFGSTRTAFALRQQGIHSIMNVKTAHKGFPKAALQSQAINRGDVAGVKVTVQGVELRGSIHKDKQPMTLIHTVGTLLPGPPRFRNFIKYDKDS